MPTYQSPSPSPSRLGRVLHAPPKATANLLTADEERTLIEVANGRQAGDPQQAKEILLRRNQGLIRQLVKRYSHPVELPFEDGLQEAALGFLRALQLWNPSEGVKLSTYALPHMFTRLRRARANNRSLIYVPPYKQDQMLGIQRAVERFAQEIGREPTIEEAAHYLDLSEEVVKEAIQSMRFVYSLDWLGGSARLTTSEPAECLGDLLEAPDADPAGAWLTAQADRDECERLLAMIANDRDRDIFRRRYGLPPYDDVQSYRDIAGDINMSFQNVQLIAEKVKTFLRRQVGTEPQPINERQVRRQRDKEIGCLGRKGWTIMELALLFDLSENSVRRVLVEAKCQTKNK